MAVGTKESLSLAPGTEIPANVSALAAGANLGELRAVEAPRKLGWFIIIINVILGLITAFVIVGLWVLWMVAKNPRFSRKQAAKRVYLFDNGFVYAEADDQLTAYRWDQIVTVYQSIRTTRVNGVKTATRYAYTIARVDGVSVTLTNLFGRIAQIGQWICNRTCEAQLPQAVAAVEQGQTLHFGALAVSANGLTVRGVEVPWHSGSIRLQNGFVSVKRAGTMKPLRGVQATEVPNLYVLLSLTAKYGQATPGR